MRITGLSFGRKMQNCEILVKQALMAAEADGAEVEFYRMLDYDIKPCRNCGGCIIGSREGGSGQCVIKDDFHIIENAILDSDAIIVAAPVFMLFPCGQFKEFLERFGSTRESAVMLAENEKRIAEGKNGDQLIDPRCFKQKYAGLISVGGSVDQHWVSLGLVGMNLLCFPHNIKVVDQLDAYDLRRVGNPLLDDTLMERAARMGHSVANAIGKDPDTLPWFGDDEGTCPVCHCNVITLKGTTTVECPVCGIKGKLSVDGEKVTVYFSEEEKKHSRLTLQGKFDHLAEMGSTMQIGLQKVKEAGDELKAKLGQYKDYKAPGVAPVKIH